MNLQIEMFNNNLQLNQNYPVKSKKTNKTKLIGMVFGKLKVVEYIGKDKWDKFLFKCQCECGRVVTVPVSQLTQGKTTSCGCVAKAYRKAGKRKHDIQGEKFGMLTVIKIKKRDSSGNILWVCECDCGNTVIKKSYLLKNGTTTLNCGCVAKLKKEEKLNKAKCKPRNNEQYAKDLYCWYIDGWTLRDIARDNGYVRGSNITTLFMDFIPQYKQKSIQRRENSPSNKYLKRKNQISRLFRYEKDFNEYCVNVLESEGVCCESNNTSTTGLEIDIATPWECYELKICTRKKDLYTALGQLIANSKISKLDPILLIPSDTEVPKEIQKVYLSNGISIMTEKDLKTTNGS